MSQELIPLLSAIRTESARLTAEVLALTGAVNQSLGSKPTHHDDELTARLQIDYALEALYRAIDHPELVFAVTGTTSSGKSTLVDDTITRWQQLKERHGALHEQLEGLTLAHLRSTDASTTPLP